MSLAGCFHVAGQYVLRHRVRSLLLAVALGLTLALPVVMHGLLRLAEKDLHSRAQATPLVLGAKGSPLELTLNALYFRLRAIEPIPVRHAQEIRDSGLAEAIPLYVRFRAQEAPIVGTTLAYFDFRHLTLAEGRSMLRLGDCVVGAKVARDRQLHAGGSIYSSPEQVFDLAGIYPMKLRITGILADSHSADDEAIFVDIKTSWIIQGIGHGHEDLVKAPDSALLEKQQGNRVANNSVRMFNEVTDANFASFHFHGDPDDFPLSAMVILPRDAKAQAILLGRYQEGKQGVQLVQPLEEIDALLATLFQAEKLALVVLGALSVLVLLIAGLVFALSFRLRRKEFVTLEAIGISRAAIATVKSLEMLLIGMAALLVAGLAGGLVQQLGPLLVQMGVR